MFILLIFRVCKFWRGGRKDENTANAALNTFEIIYFFNGNYIKLLGPNVEPRPRRRVWTHYVTKSSTRVKCTSCKIFTFTPFANFDYFP